MICGDIESLIQHGLGWVDQVARPNSEFMVIKTFPILRIPLVHVTMHFHCMTLVHTPFYSSVGVCLILVSILQSIDFYFQY